MGGIELLAPNPQPGVSSVSWLCSDWGHINLFEAMPLPEFLGAGRGWDG